MAECGHLELASSEDITLTFSIDLVCDELLKLLLVSILKIRPIRQMIHLKVKFGNEIGKIGAERFELTQFFLDLDLFVFKSSFFSEFYLSVIISKFEPPIFDHLLHLFKEFIDLPKYF